MWVGIPKQLLKKSFPAMIDQNSGGSRAPSWPEEKLTKRNLMLKVEGKEREYMKR